MCTEASHLKECSGSMRDVYTKLKSTFLSAGGNVVFKPREHSIRVWIGDEVNIAEIFFRKTKGIIGLECRKLEKNDTDAILKHHEARRHSERKLHIEYVILSDANHWDEIQTLIGRLLRRHRA